MSRFVALVGLVAATASVIQAQPTRDADALFAAKDWVKAEASYKSEVTVHPRNGRAWFRLGGTLHAAGRHVEARSAFEKAIATGFQPSYGMVLMSREFGEESDLSLAQEWLEKAAAAGFAQPAILDADLGFEAIRSQPWFSQIRARLDLNSRPCTANPSFRQFDFWLGEWEVESGGTKVAHSSIQSILDGCIIQENWMPLAGQPGKSWNLFNTTSGKWEQTWMSAGNVARLEGEFRGGAMQFTSVPTHEAPTASQTRMSFTPLPDGTIRQLWQQTQDGGISWKPMFDGIYRRASKQP